MSYIRELHMEAADHADKEAESNGTPSKCTCADGSGPGDCPWCTDYYTYLEEKG